MSSPQSGHNQMLFRLRRGWFFENPFNLIKLRSMGNSLAANRAVEWQQALTSRLHRRNGAVFRGRDANQLFRASPWFPAEVKMVADQMEKGIIGDELARAVERVPVSQGRGLFHETEAIAPASGGGEIDFPIPRTNHNADFLGAGAQGFFDDDLQGGFLDAIAIHQRLKGEPVLVSASRRYDCLFDFHGRFVVPVRKRRIMPWTRQL